MAEVQDILIYANGTAVPDSCTLSKTGKDGLPKRVNWVADDKKRDFSVTFEQGSPFKEKLFTVKQGGPEPSNDITVEVKPDEAKHYKYMVRLIDKEKEVAADPEVIIRN